MASVDERPGTKAKDDESSLPFAKKGDLVVVGGGAAESLQDRFLRFRKERQRELALTRRLAARPMGKDSRDVDGLRQRFVDGCYSYIGVPYARKAHEPDDPDYDAPLFLDCCGLVRRVVQDLQENFGFSIGRWNQAYQLETLPVEVCFDELKPGDLIFVEGVYYDEKKKPQRHNIVHVEVFIGGDTGEATIGSRWSKSDPANGKVRGVQIHPSYKYVSKNYEIKRFIFRSLETWLNGICRSQSYPDAIAKAATKFGGKSVFEEPECGSGEENDEESGHFTPDPYRSSPTFYIGEGNNWRVVAEALEKRGWQRLPFEAHFTSRFDLKWVEQRSKIDYKRHLEGQLVNHIPNNCVITNKAQFIVTMRSYESTSDKTFPWHPETFLSERAADKLAALTYAEANPETIWILKPSRGLGGNGIEILRGPVELRAKLFPPSRDLADKTQDGGPHVRDVWVIQRYIERPLLLVGRKFDMRAYCLVARTAPHHLWFFHPGYCKVALESYDPACLDNRFSHLTNACVQKGHPDYRDSFRGAHIWSESDAETHLVAAGRSTSSIGEFWPPIHNEMKTVLLHIYEASKGTLERRRGYFDLLGVDFMLDDSYKLYLLEVNSNPAMFFDSSPTLQELVPRLIGDALDLVLAAQHPDKSMAIPQSSFELLVDEATSTFFQEE
mmetsp:Transcript_55578/g.88173  ORF Transcript_55578/g.88173 Transcript_55578/m.88173 type:complete len:668 (-) Transcript_55578:107-2110(-)